MKVKSIIKQFSLVLMLMVAALTLFSFAPAALAANVGFQGDENITGTNQIDARDYTVTLIRFILSFLGLIAVGYTIYGGFLYVTSGGEDDGPGKAKKIIINAIIGIVIIFASFVIVDLALDAGRGEVAQQQ